MLSDFNCNRFGPTHKHEHEHLYNILSFQLDSQIIDRGYHRAFAHGERFSPNQITSIQ